MDKEDIFSELRKKGLRITPQRKAIFEILENEHLTIGELFEEMKLRGYNNLMTIYNNIDFLIEQDLVTQININGKKYYDLAVGNYHHNADEHIHFTCNNSPEIVEISGEEIFNIIKGHKAFENYDLDKICITLYGTCKKCLGEKCEKNKKNTN